VAQTGSERNDKINGSNMGYRHRQRFAPNQTSGDPTGAPSRSLYERKEIISDERTSSADRRESIGLVEEEEEAGAGSSPRGPTVDFLA